MVVEHSFITTLEANDALAAASQLLQAFGFFPDPQNTYLPGAGAHTGLTGDGLQSLQLSRGSADRMTGRGIADWPQQVHLRWDRGKVEVAASITPPAYTRSWNVSLTGSTTVKPHAAETALMQEYLMALATSVELLLAHRQANEAQETLSRVMLRLQASAHDRRRRNRTRMIWVVVIVLLLIGLLAVIIVATSH